MLLKKDIDYLKLSQSRCFLALTILPGAFICAFGLVLIERAGGVSLLLDPVVWRTVYLDVNHADSYPRELFVAIRNLSIAIVLLLTGFFHLFLGLLFVFVTRPTQRRILEHLRGTDPQIVGQTSDG